MRPNLKARVSSGFSHKLLSTTAILTVSALTLTACAGGMSTAENASADTADGIFMENVRLKQLP